MNNVIQKVVNDIKSEIPRAVLEVAFLGSRGRNGRFSQQLDWFIKNKILDGRVREDCNLLGAIETTIPLRYSDFERTDETYSTTVRIPMSVTEGREIVEVLAYNYSFNSGGSPYINTGATFGQYDMRSDGNSPLMGQAHRALNTASSPGILSTTNVRIIGPNVILINDWIGTVKQSSLTVRLASDAAMSHLKPATVPQFSQLCVLYAKAFIYNETIVNLDDAYIDGGADLNRLSSIIESYADAMELYKEYFRDEWTAVQFMNDEARHGTHLRGIMGGQG